MNSLLHVLLMSSIFSFVLLHESEAAPIDGGRVVDDGAPGVDVLQVLQMESMFLQEETRQVWQEALRQLKSTLGETHGEIEEIVCLQSSIRRLETCVYALGKGKLCTGEREEVDRRDERVYRVVHCLYRALEGCSAAWRPSTPVSSLVPCTPTTIEFLTSAPGSTSASYAAPPVADTARRRALGDALYNASRDGKVEDVERLLNDGADPNYDFYGGMTTPLMRAARNGHATVVSLLLQKGADVSAKDMDEWTALHYAAYDHSGRVVPLLVAAGAHLHSRTNMGSTPLHLASIEGNEAAVRALLAAGASKALVNGGGQTPFDVAESAAIHELLRP